MTDEEIEQLLGQLRQIARLALCATAGNGSVTPVAGLPHGGGRAMSRAVLYVRVSTAEQVDSFSLATQERACREYCEREGLEVDRIFREEGESAKTANRPGLQELLTYCATESKRRGLKCSRW